jgi:hypothetical protein
MATLIPVEVIASKIYLIRGIKVMLDRDLAELYDVETKNLKRAVRRNIDRFPNIQIMRAFTQLRKMLSTHEDLKRKIESMEKKYDEHFQIVFEAIKQLLSEEDKPKKKIGFTVKEKQKAYAKRG